MKIRILFMYSSKGFGGIVRNLSLLVNNLPRDRFDVFVILLANKGDDRADLKLSADLAAHVYRIDERSVFDQQSLRQIDSIMVSGNIDVVSCHGYKADIYGVILRWLYHRKTRWISMVHGWTMAGPKVRFYHLLDKICLRYFDRIILVSQNLERSLKWFGIPRKKISVVHNAVDMTAVEQAGTRLVARRILNLKEEDVVIGVVGRLSREKDLRTSIEAFRIVLESQKSGKLLVIGDGPEKDNVARWIKRFGLDGAVILAGYRNDAGCLYPAMDVYVSSSLTEGLPNSLLEAQASGVPCVVTDVRGNSDVVVDGLNGLLVRPRDPQMLSRAILTLLRDKALADTLVVAARRRLQERFSMSKRMKTLENIYTELRGG